MGGVRVNVHSKIPCKQRAILQFRPIAAEVGRTVGSGANARVADDDEEMQRFVPIEDLFKGRHFERQIIVLCVSWYTSFKLSLRDLVIMMADRGISVTHTTILSSRYPKAKRVADPDEVIRRGRGKPNSDVQIELRLRGNLIRRSAMQKAPRPFTENSLSR